MGVEGWGEEMGRGRTITVVSARFASLRRVESVLVIKRYGSSGWSAISAVVSSLNSSRTL